MGTMMAMTSRGAVMLEHLAASALTMIGAIRDALIIMVCAKYLFGF
jgi:hypothetical protein